MEAMNDILSIEKIKKEYANNPNELDLSGKRHSS